MVYLDLHYIVNLGEKFMFDIMVLYCVYLKLNILTFKIKILTSVCISNYVWQSMKTCLFTFFSLSMQCVFAFMTMGCLCFMSNKSITVCSVKTIKTY